MGKIWYKKTNQGEKLAENKNLIYKLASQYGINEIIIFGSVARGDANEDSDIDMLVNLDLKKHHPDSLLTLSRQIRNKIGYDCDISCKLTMNESVYRDALREGKKL
jgi:predicted nucleotidyltransferase